MIYSCGTCNSNEQTTQFQFDRLKPDQDLPLFNERRTNYLVNQLAGYWYHEQFDCSTAATRKTAATTTTTKKRLEFFPFILVLKF